MATQTEATNNRTISKDMRFGLFIPCYIDMMFPEVGIATLQLLERFGLNVTYPLNQTCCGQPMATTETEGNSAPAEHLFVENFHEYHFIIGPAGSCAKHVPCPFDTLD